MQGMGPQHRPVSIAVAESKFGGSYGELSLSPLVPNGKLSNFGQPWVWGRHVVHCLRYI